MNQPTGKQRDMHQYTATAVNRCVTFSFHYADLFKIPHKAREQMCVIAQIRKKIIQKRTIEHFINLKSIQKKLDDQGEAYDGKGNVDLKKMQKSISDQTLALGNRLRDLVDKESVYKPPLDEKTLKKERLKRLGVM